MKQHNSTGGDDVESIGAEVLSLLMCGGSFYLFSSEFHDPLHTPKFAGAQVLYVKRCGTLGPLYRQVRVRGYGGLTVF